MIRVDMERLKATPLKRQPYDYLVVEKFVPEDCIPDIDADFPEIEKPGSFPLADVESGPNFEALIERLRQDDFRHIIEEKFDIDLTNRPLTCTVRGATQLKDGKIHTDSLSKLITVLIYLNPEWNGDGGRLRVLNGKDDLTDYAEEIEPDFGTMLIFRRSENSWHGHEPFQGRRRTIQINWVTSQTVADREHKRHRMSATLKRFNPFAARTA